MKVVILTWHVDGRGTRCTPVEGDDAEAKAAEYVEALEKIHKENLTFSDVYVIEVEAEAEATETPEAVTV